MLKIITAIVFASVSGAFERQVLIGTALPTESCIYCGNSCRVAETEHSDSEVISVSRLQVHAFIFIIAR